jgi:hypothetical protein
VESLKRQHGRDVKMPGLLVALVADCPKTRSFSIHDRCKAVDPLRVSLGTPQVPGSVEP